MQPLFAKHIGKQDIIIHSDQGRQFTSKRIKSLISKYGIKASNSRAGNCLDNAVVENFFSHYKSELIYVNKIETFTELVSKTNKYMYFYNNRRKQLKTKMTPVAIREQFYNNNRQLNTLVSIN
jgi:transposase InsO family protein